MKAREQLHADLLEMMILIRGVERRILELYRAGKIVGAIHLSIGQEAIPAGVCARLRDDDAVFSTHRGHGHAVAKGCDLGRMFAELMGRDDGLCRGHGGSMHLFEAAKGLMGGNGIVGGGLPLALGPAFAAQYRGTDQVSVCFFGEGASNQGTFHEALNLAALWKLPVVYVCENNQIAATTPATKSCAKMKLSDRAFGYGIPGVTVDGNKALDVCEAAGEAVGRARRGEGPSLLECVTYRVEPHCGIIADKRDRNERESWLEKDPINLFKASLLNDKAMTEATFVALEKKVQEHLNQAVAFALNSPFPDPNDEIHNTWVAA